MSPAVSVRSSWRALASVVPSVSSRAAVLVLLTLLGPTGGCDGAHPGPRGTGSLPADADPDGPSTGVDSPPTPEDGAPLDPVGGEPDGAVAPPPAPVANPPAMVDGDPDGPPPLVEPPPA